jgi:predicted RNA-binding protein with PUA-like domain
MPSLLLKTEPSTYSFADLQRDKKTTWGGITNNAALLHLRTGRKGDTAFIYHTGDEKQIVGLAKVLTTAYEDPKNPGKTPAGEPKFAVVDLAPVKAAKTPLSLAAMKADPRFKNFELLRQSRLSVVPVPEDIVDLIKTLTGLQQ